MSHENTRISFGFDPTIENLKPVLSFAEGSKIENRKGWTRRELLRTAAIAGTGAFLGLPRESTAAEGTPETKQIRIIETPEVCTGVPLIVSQELLKSEGFADVQPVKRATGVDGTGAVATGDADLTLTAAPSLITRIDADEPLVVLGGLHVGCFELFGTDRIRSLRDLKGKDVAVTRLRSGRHLLLAAILKHVGLDPHSHVNWIQDPAPISMKRFAEGKIDAFMGFPPEPQELRAKKVGRVIVNTTTDKPWSQYFCCMAVANRQFVRKNPIATKRALRALLKAATVCTLEPQRAVQIRSDKGYTAGFDYALQTIRELPYNKWREYDPEDTMRFYALRLHEAGMIKSNPQKIIAQGTNWQFLRELKKELKS